MEQDKNKKKPTPNRGSAPVPSDSLNRGDGQFNEKKAKKGHVLNEQKKKMHKTDDQDINEERDII